MLLGFLGPGEREDCIFAPRLFEGVIMSYVDQNSTFAFSYLIEDHPCPNQDHIQIPNVIPITERAWSRIQLLLILNPSF